MTAQEQALARDEALHYLREQMGEGWVCVVASYIIKWLAFAEYSGRPGKYRNVTVAALGPDPMSAAKACVEAWREATSDAARLAALGASGVARHASKRADEAEAELRAERAHADRLAAIVKQIRSDGYMVKGALFVAIEEMLAAHDARRAGEWR